MGIPVVFGPFMHAQEELVRNFAQFGVGQQVEISDLPQLLEHYLSQPGLMEKEGEKGKEFARQVGGSAAKTWAEIKKQLVLT